MTTNNNHEPPWRYEPSAHSMPTIVDAHGNLICTMGSADAAVAQRIVAAVNSISKIAVIELSERTGASPDGWPAPGANAASPPRWPRSRSI